MSWEKILKRESCCENAKNRVRSIFTDRIERIKRGDGFGSIENERQNIETLEMLDCDELKDYLRYEVRRMKNDPTKDELLFKEILEEWNTCEDNR
jgi:hypothetical protein|tara:strand:+ start:1538 stop:1822 length:285 start_codon:yes stop_codon:yes gene_type:complete